MFGGAPGHVWVEPEARDRAQEPPACQDRTEKISDAGRGGGVEMHEFSPQLSMKRYVKFAI